jgi:small subunit ribosomal protein S1
MARVLLFARGALSEETNQLTAERVEEQTADQPAATSTDTAAEAAETPTAPAADTSPSQQTDSPAEAASEGAGPTGTAAPSPEAAIGASGARPLGDAEEVAVKAEDAVDQMVKQAGAALPADDAAQAADDDAAPAAADDAAQAAEPAQADAGDTDSQAAAATDGAGAEDQAAAPPADGTAAAATADDQPSSAEDDQPAQATAQAPAPTAPERRPVPEGPEPTTMEELLNEQPGEIRSLKHGDVVEGNVVRIDKDEILVDIGAKSEGVVSNRELYGRNAETQPQLNIGDTVLVYVLQPESPEGHAVLSLRRAGLERKWRAMQEQLDAGTIIEAPVIDHNKGGLIVDCGIRGFVPISQIVDFPRRPQNEQPRDAAQEIAEKLQPYVGRKLRLKILEVNRKANRLILSEKVALYEERREKRDELFSSLQVGQKVTGTVRSIAPFGVFIDLGGIDGLVHKSELSWNKVNNPESGYKIGEEVEAEVIDINHERGRISLSIRRLQPDPWHSSVADMKVGDLIDGAVTKIVNFGAFVRVRDGLEGLIHISELSHQRVVHPGDVVHEGQRLKLKVISLDSERHRLGLSLKQAEEEPAPRPERERRPRQERGGGYDPSQAVQEPEGGIDNTLAAAFAQVRQQMQETEAARQTAEPAEADAEPEATAGSGADAQADAVLEAADEARPGDVTTAPGDAPALEVGAAGGDVAQPEAAATGAEAAAEPTTEAATDQPAESAGQAEPTTEGEPAAQAEPASATADAAGDTEEASTAETSQAEGADAAAPDDGADTDEATQAAVPSRKGRSKKTDAPADAGAPVADTSAEPAEGSPDAAPAEGGDTEPAKG